MAIATNAASIHFSRQFNRIRPIQYGIALGLRFAWSIKAYATILGIMALALLSVLGLFLHELLSRLVQAVRLHWQKQLTTDRSSSVR